MNLCQQADQAPRLVEHQILYMVPIPAMIWTAAASVCLPTTPAQAHDNAGYIHEWRLRYAAMKQQQEAIMPAAGSGAPATAI
jgi:hypothetical protein